MLRGAQQRPRSIQGQCLILRHIHHSSSKPFRFCSALREKPLPPRPKINEDSIDESFLKGSGPGGQKINKTSSAVQLIHKPTGIVVKAQDTRSRSQNRKIARTRLAEAIEVREKGSESRQAIKAAVASRKKASAAKKSRRKYRALKAEKAGEDGARKDAPSKNFRGGESNETESGHAQAPAKG